MAAADRCVEQTGLRHWCRIAAFVFEGVPVNGDKSDTVSHLQKTEAVAIPCQISAHAWVVPGGKLVQVPFATGIVRDQPG